MHLPTKSALVAILADIIFGLTVLASLSYELGPLAEAFPPWIKPWITGLGIFATMALKIVQRIMERLQGVQDRQVIAQVAADVGVVPLSNDQTQPPGPIPPAPPRPVFPLLLLSVFLSLK